LATTAGLMMRGLQADSEAATTLHDQLQEIKDRWNRVNERAIELRYITILLTCIVKLLQQRFDSYCTEVKGFYVVETTHGTKDGLSLSNNGLTSTRVCRSKC